RVLAFEDVHNLCLVARGHAGRLARVDFLDSHIDPGTIGSRAEQGSHVAFCDRSAWFALNVDYVDHRSLLHPTPFGRRVDYHRGECKEHQWAKLPIRRLHTKATFKWRSSCRCSSRDRPSTTR